ncbi:MAG: maleylacetate reductase, partial [Deltaproteobacteria bacterium]|nr:maleylacetate reductase [Deltaproteobacteria bacterium]
MSRRFREVANSRMVVFGEDWKSATLEGLKGCERIVAITSPRQAAVGEEIVSALGERGAAVIALAKVHVPEEIVAEAMEEVRRVGADGIVTYGGG